MPSWKVRSVAGKHTYSAAEERRLLELSSRVNTLTISSIANGSRPINKS